MDDRSPKPYSYWLREAATGAVCGFARDWEDVGGTVIDLAADVVWAICATALRLAILATFPVSVPLIALWATRRNREVVEQRERRRQEMIRLIKGGQQ